MKAWETDPTIQATKQWCNMRERIHHCKPFQTNLESRARPHKTLECSPRTSARFRVAQSLHCISYKSSMFRPNSCPVLCTVIEELRKLSRKPIVPYPELASAVGLLAYRSVARPIVYMFQSQVIIHITCVVRSIIEVNGVVRLGRIRALCLRC